MALPQKSLLSTGCTTVPSEKSPRAKTQDFSPKTVSQKSESPLTTSKTVLGMGGTQYHPALSSGVSPVSHCQSWGRCPQQGWTPSLPDCEGTMWMQGQAQWTLLRRDHAAGQRGRAAVLPRWGPWLDPPWGPSKALLVAQPCLPQHQQP